MVILSKVNVHTKPLNSKTMTLKYEQAFITNANENGSITIYDQENVHVQAFFCQDVILHSKQWIAKSPDGTVCKGVTHFFLKETLEDVGETWETKEIMVKMDLNDHITMKEAIKHFRGY